MTPAERRLLLVLGVGLLPWSVQVFSTGPPTLLFAWGLVNLAPLNVTTLTDFLFRFTRGLPDFILAWPLGVVCYLVALASAVVAVWLGREDVRVTAAGLFLAGITQFEVARGFSIQPGRTAWPVGTVFLWALAGYLYWSRASSRTRE
ncbi:TIGR04206 family protein [Haloferax namakaokahaiae]|uniref:TIGR04206 family protein n=1 Tax=Haloferax namakaokahaiae TaxID=1748331 RepID=UPI0036F34846